MVSYLAAIELAPLRKASMRRSASETGVTARSSSPAGLRDVRGGGSVEVELRPAAAAAGCDGGGW